MLVHLRVLQLSGISLSVLLTLFSLLLLCLICVFMYVSVFFKLCVAFFIFNCNLCAVMRVCVYG